MQNGASNVASAQTVGVLVGVAEVGRAVGLAVGEAVGFVVGLSVHAMLQHVASQYCLPTWA